MKHTFKHHGTTFTLQVSEEVHYKQAASFMVANPDMTSTQAYAILTPEYRANERETLIRKQCDKKPRKPVITKGIRLYPKHGETMSTKEYVMHYFKLNDGNRDTSDEVELFFQPLSTRITPIEDEYSTEVTE